MVSIQLRLDGHSFSSELLPSDVAEEAVVVVELLTTKSTLVPEECFAPELAGKLLWLAGIPCSDEEIQVWSRAENGAVAVMSLHREIAEALTARYGSRVEYTSPMLRKCAGKGRYLYIYYAANVAYFKLYNEEVLELCEAMPVDGVDDVLCMVENIKHEFGLDDIAIHIDGNDFDGVVKMLKLYHKVEICE